MPDIAKWENFMYCLVTEKKAFFERGWRGGGGAEGREYVGLQESVFSNIQKNYSVLGTETMGDIARE